MSKDKVEMTWEQLNSLTAEVIADSGPGSSGWVSEKSHTRRFNEVLMEQFRENKGKVPGELEDLPLLILTTTGAKTGRRLPVPLAYLDIDDRLLVIASMGGAPRNPPWFHNLVANPEVTVEMNGEEFTARAVVTEGADRDDLFRKVCGIFSAFGEYQQKTTRKIPVIELKRV